MLNPLTCWGDAGWQTFKQYLPKGSAVGMKVQVIVAWCVLNISRSGLRFYFTAQSWILTALFAFRTTSTGERQSIASVTLSTLTAFSLAFSLFSLSFFKGSSFFLRWILDLYCFCLSNYFLCLLFSVVSIWIIIFIKDLHY